MFFIIMAHSLMPCHSAIIIHGTLADAMSFMHSSCMAHSLMPCHVFHHHGTLTGAMSFMHSSCMAHSLVPCHSCNHHAWHTRWCHVMLPIIMAHSLVPCHSIKQCRANSIQIIHFQSSQHPHWCYVIQSNNAAQLQSSNADHPMQMQLTQCRSCNAMQNTINQSGVGGWDTNSMNLRSNFDSVVCRLVFYF